MTLRRLLHIHTRFHSTFSLSVRETPLTHLFQCNRKIIELSQLGRLTDARRLFDSMSQRDSVSWNALITGYTRHEMLEEAQALFNAFHAKNVRTWTILLTGYANHGLVDEARAVFESMPERNVVSWNAMISGYLKNGRLQCAKELFNQMPVRNTATWNSMIKAYCRCGMMREAHELFNQMEEKNCVTWMAMISGFVETSEYHKAWFLFSMMLQHGVKPDQAILVVALSAATGLKEIRLTENLRTVTMKTGCEGNVVVGTAILNAYTRNGSLDHAVKYFETMQERNEYSWSTMIAAFSQCGRLDDAISLFEKYSEKDVTTWTTMMTAYAQNGRIYEARRIFDETEKYNVVTWNAMLTGYIQNGMLEKAKDMFLRMPERNATSWAAIISGFAKNGQSQEALKFFTEVHSLGIVPNHSSFASALFACANIGDVGVGRQMHSLAIKTSTHFNSFVGNGLISMYAKCKNIQDASKVFSTMTERDCISWNSLISGLSENHMLDEGQKSFGSMPQQDVVSWTTIISACEQAGERYTALKLFLEMLARGLKPNRLTVTSLLSACGYLGERNLGEQVHVLVHKVGLNSYLFVCNALITMYFKCGSLNGLCVFKEMPDQDIVTFNAVLVGCAQNGLGKEAIKIFQHMEAIEVLPNDRSYTGLLCACSHAGLVDEGWAYFNSMSQNYGITPLVYHYTCMVDLLGRAGKLDEAITLIEKMPVKPDSVIWEALLGACRIHRNTKLGQKVAEKLFKMGTTRSGTYVLLSNIYASQGMWEEVREIRKLMKERGVTKEPGISWIQIKNKVHYFRMGDMNHNEIEEINTTLNDLYRRFKATGYVPDTNFVLHDVEEEQKQDELLRHSEKLAVVYGIMHTPNGAPIHVMKNLRICGDCHSFMKYISSAANRKIVIRDGNRFHHFQDGLCSCGDYW